MRTHPVSVILVLLALALPASPAHAGGAVTVCDEAHLLAALSGGGTVTFACSGVITLTSTITIATDTTIDSSGQEVAINGNNAVRVLTVNEGVSAVLNKITITDGRAASGGGIYNEGTLTVSNCFFTGNRALVGDGGGIQNRGTLSVSNSTFSGNSAVSSGAGIRNSNGGTLIVDNSTFSVNTATGYFGSGGGIFNGDYYVANTALTVSNSTFFSNSAHDGGGIFNLNGPATVTNSTFSSNSATGYGGAICRTPGGSITVRNTIIGNSAAGGNCYGSIADGGGNLSFPDATCPGINADPLLGPLQDNGGPTHTMALGEGSAAIDAGDDAVCAAPPVNNLDQRGVARPHGTHCDIGAVEQITLRYRYMPLIMR